MPVNVLIVTATEAEAAALKKLDLKGNDELHYRVGNCNISLLVTGVGSNSTSWSMLKWFASNSRPDLVINAGIAGSYKGIYGIGDVVVPVSDLFADSGIETPDGFLTLAESKLDDPDRFPFAGGRIRCENKYSEEAVKLFSAVNAITVNTATGTEATIERLRKKFDPDIETMEGATFFYICSGENTPFLALRAISNMVEPRDKSRWNIGLAIDKLSEGLEQILLRI